MVWKNLRPSGQFLSVAFTLPGGGTEDLFDPSNQTESSQTELICLLKVATLAYGIDCFQVKPVQSLLDVLKGRTVLRGGRSTCLKKAQNK